MADRSPKWKVTTGRIIQSHVRGRFTGFSRNWMCIIFKGQYFDDKYIGEIEIVIVPIMCNSSHKPSSMFAFK